VLGTVCDRTSQEDAALPDVIGANTRTTVRCGETAEERSRGARVLAPTERERANERRRSISTRAAGSGKSQVASAAACYCCHCERIFASIVVMVRQ